MKQNKESKIMPEIYECFYALAQLLRLIPKKDNSEKELQEYEYRTQDYMEENRIKLFQEFGYSH